MRVAVWHNLPSGGGKRALYDHIAGLLGRGHSVESWCPPEADQEFLPLRELVVEHVVPMTVRSQGWATHKLDRALGGAVETLTKLKALDEHTRRCADEINRSGFDVLLAGSASSFAVTGLAQYVDAPSVLYLQEPLRWQHEATGAGFPWPARTFAGPSPVRSLLRVRDAIRVEALRVQLREELRGARAYDRVLVNSYYSRESVLRAYGVDSHVCYLGVDTTRYVDRGVPRQPLVVGLGAIHRHKRIEAAIEAVADVSAPRPALAWIGNAVDRDYLERLRRLARDRGITFSPRIAVPHSEVVELLNQASVMVYAPRLEPFGYAPLEAGACGLPVVATAEGGIRETVLDGETGFLVDGDAELGPAVARLVGDADLGRRMGAAARRNVEMNWSLDQATLRLESHLMATASTRRRAAE